MAYSRSGPGHVVDSDDSPGHGLKSNQAVKIDANSETRTANATQAGTPKMML